jgi:hypothetical protein
MAAPPGVRHLAPEPPGSPDELVGAGSSLLDAAQLAFFEANGYTEGRTFLTDDGLAFCRSNIDRLIYEMTTGQPDRPLADTISPHQCPGGGWLWELIVHPTVVAAAQRQIGTDVLCWSTHLLIKEPRSVFDVPWHQDSPYWNMRGDMAAAVWIALDDVDAENGTMEVLPGYHKRGVLPRVLDTRAYFAQHIDPAALPSNLDKLKRPYYMKAGQAALHGVLCPHSSGPNASERWRRVIVLRYIAADAELGVGVWRDFRGAGAPFPREYFLVGGEDRLGRGYRRSPYDTSAPGYLGDPQVQGATTEGVRVMEGAVLDSFQWVKVGGAMVRSDSPAAKAWAATGKAKL